MSNQAISELLSKLEKAGYIIRKQSETDRRAIDIILTDAGIETANQLEQKKYDIDRIFEVLNDDERKNFSNYLTRIIDELEKQMEEDGDFFDFDDMNLYESKFNERGIFTNVGFSMTGSSNSNIKKGNEGKVKIVRPEGTVKIVKPEGKVKIDRDLIYTGKNEKLKELINNDCPKDEVIKFVIGIDSRHPTFDEMCYLLHHITDEKQGDEEGAVLAFPKGKISKETLEKLISQIRDGYFTRKNLILLWSTAKDVKKRKTLNGVLIALGILGLVAGGIFLANVLAERDPKNALVKDDNSKDKSLLGENSINEDDSPKDTYTDDEFFGQNNPYPEDFDLYTIGNIYYKKCDDGMWHKVEGNWEDGLFHEIREIDN